MPLSLHEGDCLSILPTLPDASVDCVLSDLPYGVSNASWDRALDLGALWAEWKRLLKPSGVVLLFGCQPYTSDLIVSNRKWFRYCWYWQKNRPTGFLNARIGPLKTVEDVCVFCRKGATYHPQMVQLEKPVRSNGTRTAGPLYNKSGISNTGHREYTESFPRQILTFSKDEPQLHPSQKPLALVEYLLRTHTDPGHVVLDPCMGAGTTGLACKNLDREFIGVELDAATFRIARDRITVPHH